MKKIIFVTSIICLFFVLGIFYIFFYNNNLFLLNKNNNTSNIIDTSMNFEKNSSEQIILEDNNINSQENNIENYEIKNHNGYIAVFKLNNNINTNIPMKITSINVKDLPEFDQKLLQAGIKVNNLQELNIILEDYCS